MILLPACNARPLRHSQYKLLQSSSPVETALELERGWPLKRPPIGCKRSPFGCTTDSVQASLLLLWCRRPTDFNEGPINQESSRKSRLLSWEGKGRGERGWLSRPKGEREGEGETGRASSKSNVGGGRVKRLLVGPFVGGRCRSLLTTIIPYTLDGKKVDR